MKQMMNVLSKSLAIAFCVVLTTGCGAKTPKRGPIQRDVRKHANGHFASKIEYYLDDTGKAVKHGREARYYENGNFHVRGYNKDGKPNGRWEEFYPDGTYKGLVNFTDGEVDGKYAMWHANGHLKVRGENKKGLQIGEWVYYNDQGQTIKREVYKKGEKLSEETFNPEPFPPGQVPKPKPLPKAGIPENKAIPAPQPKTDDEGKDEAKDGDAPKKDAPKDADKATPTDSGTAPKKPVDGETEPKAEK